VTVLVESEIVEVVGLTTRMVRAMRFLVRSPGGTCTIVGTMLTGRQSAYGHQTSAREGGRTLTALRRRGLVLDYVGDDGLRVWNLTEKGRQVAATIRGGVGR
jgi:hypothetical protein